MNNLQRYTRNLIKWMLAAICLVPALGWAHGAPDIPPSRGVYCNGIGGVSWPPDGTGISDLGCRAAALYFNNTADREYSVAHWHEFAKLIGNYENDDAVKAQIPDGKLCSAGNPKHAGMSVVTPDWHKTIVTLSNGTMRVRMIGPILHTPSYIRFYLTKPGFNSATMPLKWENLEAPIEKKVNLEDVKPTAGMMPPPPPGLSPVGYFAFDIPVTGGARENAILFTRWQRYDTAGEGFYNCSDITVRDSGIPPSPWTEKGPFISPATTPKVGERVQFRLLGDNAEGSELINVQVPITASNLTADKWGPELANLITAKTDIIRLGKMVNNTIVYYPTNIYDNLVFVSNKAYLAVMSIIPGDGQVPVNPTAPVAKISGPATVQSGKPFTFNASQSVGYNGPLSYSWAIIGANQPYNQVTVNGAAVTVTQPTKHTARLNVRDPQNGKTSQVEFDFTVTPSGGGGDYPPYVPGGQHEAGKIYSHNGENYKCKYAAWCSGSAQYYEPGKGLAWGEAWDKQ